MNTDEIKIKTNRAFEARKAARNAIAGLSYQQCQAVKNGERTEALAWVFQAIDRADKLTQEAKAAKRAHRAQQ